MKQVNYEAVQAISLLFIIFLTLALSFVSTSLFIAFGVFLVIMIIYCIINVIKSTPVKPLFTIIIPIGMYLVGLIIGAIYG